MRRRRLGRPIRADPKGSRQHRRITSVGGADGRPSRLPRLKFLGDLCQGPDSASASLADDGTWAQVERSLYESGYLHADRLSPENEKTESVSLKKSN